MTLEIYPNTTLAEIQSWFQRKFPFLKIAFLDKAHGFGQTIGKAYQYSPSFSLNAIRCKATNRTLRFQPWMRTGDVEMIFEKELGLHVQVYRNENGRWIETAGTDEFTLSEQNDIGRRFLSQAGGHLPLERIATCNL